MVRYYCDRCRDEVPTEGQLWEVILPAVLNKSRMEQKRHVCRSCAIELYDYLSIRPPAEVPK